MDRKEIFELLCVQRVDRIESAISDDVIFKKKTGCNSVDKEFDFILEITDKIIERSFLIENEKNDT